MLYGQLLVPGPADGLPAGGQQLAEHKKQVIRYCGADCTVLYGRMAEWAVKTR